MSLSSKIGKILVTCGTVLLLATPLMAGHGPGNGDGNDGDGPKDGGGYDPGDCTTVFELSGNGLLLAGNGNGHGNQGSGENGGNGPGDGTGNDGDGPQDGTGNGTGSCQSS